MLEFANRRIYILVAFALVLLIILGRLFYIQVIDDYYRQVSERNVLRYEMQYPARGLIFDRNGELLVANQTVYDIMVVPREVQPFDTTALATLLGSSLEDVSSNLQQIKNKAKKNAAYQPTLFARQISSETYAALQEQWFKFPGFYATARSLRSYPKSMAGNLIGYVSEATPGNIATDPFYIQGSNIGKIGIERSYETVLRGRRGVSIFMRDKLNRIRTSYAGGTLDTVAIPGANLTSTIDAVLQQYGELLMQNKVGSIVAIEPATGEILALISAPNFDPAAFVDVHRTPERGLLALDPLKPLFNRAIMAQYPPGSIFKPVNALIALQEGVATPRTTYPCHGGYVSGRITVGCHGHFSPVNMEQSIQVSCNAYYCNIFRSLIDKPQYGSPQAGFEVWRKHVESFGIGRKLDSDLPNELKGILATQEMYNRMHGTGRWKSLSIVSLAIGQGELGITPLHMANLAAIIANRGFYYTPHVVKKIEGQAIDSRFTTPNFTTIAPQHYSTIVDGMYLAVNGEGGSTARIAHIPGIEVCGKTGTAQNPHGEDHSIFICFAPRVDPKIAIAVYIENGGFGARWAAPAASLMVEKYLTGNVTRTWMEKYVMEANLLNVDANTHK